MPEATTKTIRSDTVNLLLVRKFVGEAARQFGFSEEDSSKIVLAVDEACTNIIKHAYHNATDRNIHISINPGKGKLEVSIIDDGDAFDPEIVKPLNLKEHLSKYRRGGLGVYLIKSLMDKVEYRSIPGKKNEVRLTKFLQAVRSSAHK